MVKLMVDRRTHKEIILLMTLGTQSMPSSPLLIEAASMPPKLFFPSVVVGPIGTKNQ